jgi:hypothetical protein
MAVRTGSQIFFEMLIIEIYFTRSPQTAIGLSLCL